ncbi:MAG: altronate dehydratase [Acidobacteria bacterium]|nr:altronate dehydratase [Acidobacteriota bacterium]
MIDIDPAATPQNSAILLHADDTVVIARVPLSANQTLIVQGEELPVISNVPAGHKVARRAIAAGENVVRYGQVIGRATRAIARGEHIHTQNLAFDEGSRAYEFPERERTLPAPPAEMPTFLGYPRADGRVGTRNYIAVAAASNCAAHVAELVVEHFRGREFPEGVDGVVGFPHGDGCGHSIGPDTRQLERVIRGVIYHPNVAGAVIVGLGCEINLVDHYLKDAAPERLTGMTLQQVGGTPATVEAGIRAVEAHIERAAAMRRVETPASKIVLGLNCGGSDSFSGITANPALGACSDMLARIGATATLAETPEIFGAEHLLVKRARNRAVAEKLLGVVASYKAYLAPFGGSFDDNPSPGNKEGGLSNILEKSLGAVAKGGTLPLMDVVEYGERIDAPGLVFMNTPGYDPPSLAGLAAGGVNLIAFTTGRGSAIGFPSIPVVKIASNSNIYRRMTSNMDINAGRISDGTATVEQVGAEIFHFLLEVASGRRTCAEKWGHREFVPWRIGPVL